MHLCAVRLSSLPFSESQCTNKMLESPCWTVSSTSLVYATCDDCAVRLVSKKKSLIGFSGGKHYIHSA